MTRTIKKQENTVYVRPAVGFDPAVWAGQCTRIEDMVRDRGGRNPAFCLNYRDGGVQVTEMLKALPGLPTGQLVMNEVQMDTLAEELETCLWDFDRRTYCEDFDLWNKWEKIRRICAAGVTTDTHQGSTFNEDDAIDQTTLPFTGQDKIVIRRVALSIEQDPETTAAYVLASSVCRGTRCGSRCEQAGSCIVAMTTGLVAAGSPHLLVNDHGGDPGYWTDYELTEWTTDDAIAVVCLGDFILIASEASADGQFLRSYDQGVTRTELTGNADMVTNPVTCLDGLNVGYIMAGGQNGYIYGSWDGGDTWETLDAGVATDQDINTIRISHADPAVVYAVGVSNACIKSTNGGRTWVALTGPSAGDDLYALWIQDVQDAEHVLVGNDDGEVWETSDGGESWTQQTALDIEATATHTIIKAIEGCGCGVVWMIVKDDAATSWSLDTEQRLFRNVEGGASGRWEIVEGGMFDTLLDGQMPYTLQCCGPNRAIVGGGEVTNSFVGVAQ